MIIIFKYDFYMIICICNNISDKKISKTLDNGAKTVREVYNQCGVKPQCGSCKDYIQNKIIYKISRRELA